MEIPHSCLLGYPMKHPKAARSVHGPRFDPRRGSFAAEKGLLHVANRWEGAGRCASHGG